MPYRRATLTLTLVLSAATAALTAGPASGTAVRGLPMPPPRDHLTLTVEDSGHPGRDGTYELYCHPAGGDHPAAQDACETLDEATTWGRSPFAPVPEGSVCTGQYGGPATAHLTGTWAGRPVDADFSRANGCEIDRWNGLFPLLPRTSL